MSRSTLAVVVRHLRAKLACQKQSKESDEKMLHAFLASRDDSAFAVLVRRYGSMVLHVCRRVLGHEQDAEDAFQATFLVLAQNAARLRNKTALASFLHGTAYRIAMKAKQTAARRRKHEGQTPVRPSLDPTDELSWREVRALVDEEVACLPEKYRSVLILCCLEGVSQAEAAQRLGLKEGTLSSRLTTARKILSRRLARRGVELTTVLTVTAAEGRFVLRGFGVERFVSLRFRGAVIADYEAWIVTRPGFDSKSFNKEVFANMPKRLRELGGRERQLDGPEVTVVAEAGKILRGVVKESDTGKGRPEVLVQLTRRDRDDLLRLIIEARTDAQGRFEIRGARKAKRYMLEVAADVAAGYMPCQVWADDTPGYQPIAADITVKKGVLVTGRIINGASGKPMSGFVHIAALKQQSVHQELPRIRFLRPIFRGADRRGRRLSHGDYPWPRAAYGRGE